MLLILLFLCEFVTGDWSVMNITRDRLNPFCLDLIRSVASSLAKHCCSPLWGAEIPLLLLRVQADSASVFYRYFICPAYYWRKWSVSLWDCLVVFPRLPYVLAIVISKIPGTVSLYWNHYNCCTLVYSAEESGEVYEMEKDCLLHR